MVYNVLHNIIIYKTDYIVCMFTGQTNTDLT